MEIPAGEGMVGKITLGFLASIPNSHIRTSPDLRAPHFLDQGKVTVQGLSGV